MPYDLQPMEAPRLAGWPLRCMTFLLENPVTGGVMAEYLFEDAGLLIVREAVLAESLPSAHPLLAATPPPEPARPGAALPASAPASFVAGGFAFETIHDFQAAYRDGGLSPLVVAERVLANTRVLDEGDRPLRPFIAQDADDLLTQARASAERWRQGRPLGPLDGVPIAIKDELDQAPYPTSVGTAFLGHTPVAQDAEVVARLRRAGALLIGKANMHEIGMGVTGLNVHHGAARNPYDDTRAPGGSSSGSAVAVASGLCPVALGADGGGSIRIPAALCGLVGLKPTYGRVSEAGAAALCWSVAHIGPLAASARDAALVYQAIAGPDPRDPNTLVQPRLEACDFAPGDLKGLRLGWFRPWFEDADAAVVSVCSSMLRAFAEAGATIVEVEIPELGLASAAHSVLITSEMASAHTMHDAAHRTAYAHEIRFNLALGRRLRGTDYVQALRARSRVYQHFMRVLQDVDMILSPSTALTAPRVPEDALMTGESDLVLLDRLCRFARPGNVTGLPAISFPAGYDMTGLPVGLQALGRPWEEHRLLRLAWVAEGLVPRRKPARYHPLLRLN